MADLSVTIGADTTELEKKAKNAGKTLEKELNKGAGVKKGVDFASNLMSGNVGAAIGSLFGPIGEEIGKFIDQVISKINEAMEKARQFRILSLQTNLSTEKIQQLEEISKASGLSLGKLADNISEYNRRLGYARTHGSEMNFLLNKMGVSFDQIKNGTFDYFQALEALRKAQIAGTDEAILNHYAQVMLGSSYKELLPLIKMGSESLKQQAKDVNTTSQDSINALEKFKTYWDQWSTNFYNAWMDLLGKIIKAFQVTPEQVADEMKSELQSGKTSSEIIESGINKIGYGVTAEQRVNTMFDAIDKLVSSKQITREEGKKLFDELDKRLITPGVNLNPFGGGPAQGASQMQQMGGGDLFGAVTFNPMQETARNTAETVVELRKMNTVNEVPQSPERDALNR